MSIPFETEIQGLMGLMGRPEHKLENRFLSMYMGFHLVLLLVHRFIIARIDSTYTSYTKDNKFGLSNDEKAEFRSSAKMLMKIVLLGSIVSLGLYMYNKAEGILLVQCANALVYIIGSMTLLIRMHRPEAQKAITRAIIPRSLSRGRLI